MVPGVYKGFRDLGFEVYIRLQPDPTSRELTGEASIPWVQRTPSLGAWDAEPLQQGVQPTKSERCSKQPYQLPHQAVQGWGARQGSHSDLGGCSALLLNVEVTLWLALAGVPERHRQ